MNNIENATFETVIDEVNYYTGFVTSLESVKKQIESPETELTKQLLNVKKKFHVVITFDRDTNFPIFYKNINHTAEFMRSFPINDLLSSTHFHDISAAIEKFTKPIDKLAQLTHYPTKKCVKLIEA